MLTIDLTIASGGTVQSAAVLAAAVVPANYRLAYLIVPTMDSATLTFTLSPDASTYYSVVDSAGAALGVVGGSASTQNRVIQVLDTLSYCTPGMALKLTAGAAQSGGARAIKAVCVPLVGEGRG